MLKLRLLFLICALKQMLLFHLIPSWLYKINSWLNSCDMCKRLEICAMLEIGSYFKLIGDTFVAQLEIKKKH